MIYRSLVSPIVKDLFGDANIYAYSPNTADYTEATFTSVTVPNTSTISFHLKGMTGSASIQYIARGVGGAYIYYRGSDGRLRLYDGTNIRQFNLPEIASGAEYFIELRLGSGSTDFYLNNIYKGTATGALTDITLDSLADSMTIGALYGVTLGNQASWTMQSDTPDSFDSIDHIAGNNLTYVGAPGTIDSSHLTKTLLLEDV